jgi:hypothetical protein
MKLIASRLRRLEKVIAPARLPRIVVRFEGPGSEKFPQRNQRDIDENDSVITVQFVAAKDGRPVASS